MRISPGFCLLLAWFGTVNGWRLLGTVLLAAGLHEAGHCIALRSLGAGITGLRLGVLGAVLEVDGRRLSYGRELVTVLAGPGANLLAACLFSCLGEAWLGEVGANLVLALFNLLPIYPLDGGRMLRLLTQWAAGPEMGDWAARWIGAATAAALFCGICYLMWRTGGSLWLAPAALGALAAAGRNLLGSAED
ncbi:site-2 protease family protein [Oscillibacter sp.]|uniref:site-2 protease family protein n=1 Tax=Oscillibacter sp. TaxID=1945593 RepID=UPI0026299A5B|nr:site-2 protease family protein [Oscillibacter sp.]MDD3347984.1 site-2 protease family protein [Oscillibacter sp.]